MNKWYEEAVFYHMYPLGMTGAPKENKEQELVHRFDQLMPWVDHVKEIGCTAIYIGPLFESTTHGYDTRDYKIVDRRLGDNEDFKKFVEKAHSNGLKVIVDGVFNHTGREFFAFMDIKQNRENSQYKNWYKGINFGGNTHYNDGFGYEAWRNCYELVNLNMQERAVKDYLLDIIRLWILEFDIDGIRLDCADCLDFDFMKEMRSVTGAIKEDFWLMGEVIHGDYSRWANEEVLHSTTNYELHKGLYSGHNDHNYFEIAHTVRREFEENGGIYRGKTLYSFVDNHDVDRIISKLTNKDHVIPVYTLLYTLPGIPSLYYGSEWGIEGKKEGSNDDPLRPCLDLKKCCEDNKHPDLTKYIAALGELRKGNRALAVGKYRELLLTNRQYAFARIAEQEAVITAVNNDENQVTLEIPVPIEAKSAVDLMSERTLAVENGRIKIDIEACGSVIIKINQG